MNINVHGANKKLFIILIIVLFFSLFYVSGAFNWVTGKASGFCSGSCIDTDAGSVYIKGKVSVVTDICREEEKIDYCFAKDGKSWLKEYRCDVTTKENWKAELVYCENGCKDGACM